MQNFLLALRNIGRNRRRSLVTMLAVAISCGGLALFGGYVSWTFRAVEEQTVGSYGHIQIYKKGYYDHGTGNPAAYAIDDYEKIKKLIQNDPVIAPKLDLVTGQILFNGMVTCAKMESASTFAGLGVFPDEDQHLTEWNPYRITRANTIKQNAPYFAGAPELAEDDITGCSVGLGLGKVLRLDEKPEKKPASAAPPKPAKADAPPSSNAADGVDLNFLTSQTGPKEADTGDKQSLDLLVSPPAGGMPNATTVSLRKLMPRATKEMEDTLIKMHIKEASELLFRGQPLHVTAVIVLLKSTDDTDAMLARVQKLIEDNKLDLEFKRWEDIRPFFPRMKRMIGLIFDFVFILLVVMVSFLIYNTQSAGIMERLGEIGTLRAIGVTRLSMWRLLVLEGLMLGLIGGLLGVLLAIVGDWAFQMANIVYIPPTVTFYAKLEVLVLRNPIVLVQAFLGGLFCAVVSSALPARKAARMEIVEALRHS
jgi:putative ABC transport system permease protein